MLILVSADGLQEGKENVMILVKPFLIKPILSTNHATVDVSQKLFNLWTAPVQHDIKLLQAYLDEPLSPDWKVPPLSHFDWKQLLTSEPTGHLACSDQDLELVFKQCDDETAKSIRVTLMATTMGCPPDKNGSEDLFHTFWDANFRNMLSVCLDAE